MYTQCPECDVAFRVTADVLKQAAGKVRCGGCGVPFNALEHLSEEKPQDRTRREPEAPVGELTAELPADPGETKSPRTISAEQSAALLKTLDQLAGDDIRIEDTGVEWRVLDVDDVDDDDDNDDTPDVIDAREEPEAEAEPSAASEELRFDDNTPLPDDFDLDREPAFAALPEPPAVEISEPPQELDLSHVDLAFGDPEEWKDLLGEVVEAGAAEAEEDLDLAAEAESAAPCDDEPEHDVEPDVDQPLDMDTQFALQAEALGVDLSGLHESIEHEPIEEVELESAADDEFAETSIDEDLIAAAFEAEATARKEVSAAEEMLDGLDSDEEDDVETGTPEIDEADLEAVLALAAEDAPDEATEDEISEELAIEFEEDTETESEDQSALELVAELEAAYAVEDPAEEPEEEPEEELEEEAEEELEEEPEEQLEEEPEEDQGTEEGHHIPAPTEEEMTINMMIDQDLLAIAVEDDDGFTSTIVQKQVSSEDEIPKEKTTSPAEDEVDDEKAHDEKVDDKRELEIQEILKQADNPLVETIIMEGESFRGEMDEEQEAAKAGFMAQAKEAFRHDDHVDEQSGSSANIGIIAGLVLLLLLLAMQVLHQHREELATLPAFNNSVAPIYRSIGQPITPAWNISGWRIEASKGTADEDDEELTIYSRVGNTSDSALPYPLMHVALTDRFSEIIGSRVLEPAEYLVGDSDPRKTIEPGDTFNAVITVESPSPNTTGYNLNPCYRLDGGQLRCKIEDFK